MPHPRVACRRVQSCAYLGIITMGVRAPEAVSGAALVPFAPSDRPFPVHAPKGS